MGVSVRWVAELLAVRAGVKPYWLDMVAGDKLEIEPIIFISVTVCYRLHCQEVSPARSHGNCQHTGFLLLGNCWWVEKWEFGGKTVRGWEFRVLRYDAISILIKADSRGVEGVVDQGMILGWRSPINPLNSLQPQPRIWCNTGQYVLFVTTITAAEGGDTEQWSSGDPIRGEVATWRGPDISGHLITFTTPHLHNVNNHNKHQHIPQLNVFWIY